MRVDLTNTKTVSDIKKLGSIYSNYELEIEYGSDSKPDVSHLKSMYSMTESLLKLLQQSAFIVGNKQAQEVVRFYRDATGVSEETFGLVARQPVSLRHLGVALRMCEVGVAGDVAPRSRM